MDYDPSNEEHRKIMEHLLEEGAAILDGIDEDGEPVYKFDLDILEEVMPDLYQVIMDDMDSQLIDLYQKGLIEVDYDENLNAHMTVSQEGRQAMIDAGFDMDSVEEEF